MGDWTSASKTCNSAKVAKCSFGIGPGMESRFRDALPGRANLAKGVHTSAIVLRELSWCLDQERGRSKIRLDKRDEFHFYGKLAQ